jgi:uncharacterized protein (UPF0548 family)
MNLAAPADKPFTYSETGAAAGDLPAGYHHIPESAVIAAGRDRFESAAASVMRWGMFRGAGLRAAASSDVAEVDSVVLVPPRMRTPPSASPPPGPIADI